ncbi:Transmembrane protein 144 [Strongyloides ratti]|uniref:Transmembrane protein 144 n=1 Tax=Strongyloides ratti TaxID=34506 RepID=A0A090KU88_STRRB|nr:Transmembrane protein 144 [Strongyloides ratti]CEF59430.1 Transmembrane protein 144 [Strongyloides ratti]
MKLKSFDEDTSFMIQNIILPNVASKSNNNFYLGVLYCIIAAIGFGSMYVPILRYNKGNGALSQFGTGVGILFGSFIHAIYNQEFYINIYPMFGGFLWSIANFGSFFIIDVFGIGIGMLLWNVGNCVTGWITGYYGLFGIKARKPKHFIINIIGVFLIIISGIVFSFVKKSIRNQKYIDIITLQTYNRNGVFFNVNDINSNNEKNIFYKNEKYKKILGIVIALICGFFYASTTTPIYYLLNNPNELVIGKEKFTSSSYILSLGLGVFITTSLIFFISIRLYGLKSDILGNKDIMLSSILSGLIWFNSMYFMLKAIDIVSQIITYPIMSISPGLIGILWSIFYFKEICGTKNYIAIFIAMFIAICGIFLLVFSKI